MLRFSFFKTPRHRKFDFPTRYYDADKEELEERIKQAQAEVDAERGVENEEGVYVSRIKGQIRKQSHRRSRRMQKQSNLRLLIIIAALVALAYYLFYY